MEECQAVVTRVPLPLRLLRRCCHRRCYGVAPHSVAAASVAAVLLPAARHARGSLSNSNSRLPWYHEPRRPSRPLPLTDNQTPRTGKQYYIRQRVTVYLRLLEVSNGSNWDIRQPQYSIPPANGRTNTKCQCHPGTVSPSILQLSTGRLGKTTANCQILLQQHPNRNHKSNPLLCQQWRPPTISARSWHQERRKTRSNRIR